MVQAIVNEACPEQVILFDSYARGNSGEGSDVDLEVGEFEPLGPERDRHKEMGRFCHALEGSCVATSDDECARFARLLFCAAELDPLMFRNMAAGVPGESFGFHVQHAAEKIYKAWLALPDEMYPLPHNLEALLDLLANRNVATKPLWKLIGYTPYAVEFRYESVDSSNEPPEEVKAAWA